MLGVILLSLAVVHGAFAATCDGTVRYEVGVLTGGDASEALKGLSKNDVRRANTPAPAQVVVNGVCGGVDVSCEFVFGDNTLKDFNTWKYQAKDCPNLGHVKNLEVNFGDNNIWFIDSISLAVGDGDAVVQPVDEWLGENDDFKHGGWKKVGGWKDQVIVDWPFCAGNFVYNIKVKTGGSESKALSNFPLGDQKRAKAKKGATITLNGECGSLEFELADGDMKDMNSEKSLTKESEDLGPLVSAVVKFGDRNIWFLESLAVSSTHGDNVFKEANVWLGENDNTKHNAWNLFHGWKDTATIDL